MRRLLFVLIFLIFLFIVNNCFCQGVLWCDIDVGCWLCPDYRPTLPPFNVCHASSPSVLIMYARSSLSNGEPCPINWDLDLGIRSSDYYTSDDCFINGCHLHPRITDPSQYQKMLTSIGGIRIKNGSDTFSNSIYEEDRSFFLFDVAKPEASGCVHLLVRASIPPGCWRDKILEANPGWRFENDDPNSDWIWTEILFPYQISGLVELPDGTDYIKSSNLSNHIPHQFYGTSDMISKVQTLANKIRTEYEEGTKYKVKVSINDLSLEYGGIFDYQSQWNCDHKLHREGKSVDFNGISSPCLICDSGQANCENKYSSNDITLKKKDNTTETLSVKKFIDDLAREKGLTEEHTRDNDWHIHLELEEKKEAKYED